MSWALLSIAVRRSLRRPPGLRNGYINLVITCAVRITEFAPADYNRTVSIRPFVPQFMPVGILTAALQELTPRDIRDEDPD